MASYTSKLILIHHRHFKRTIEDLDITIPILLGAPEELLQNTSPSTSINVPFRNFSAG